MNLKQMTNLSIKYIRIFDLACKERKIKIQIKQRPIAIRLLFQRAIKNDSELMQLPA